MLQKNIAEEEAITKSVATQNILPSESERKYVNDIIKKISSKYSNELVTANIENMGDKIRTTVTEECNILNIPFEQKKRIEKIVLLTVLGNGPIEPFLQDPTVTEVVVQHYDNIVIERNGKIEKTDITFTDEDHLQTIIKRIVQKVGRQISITNPIVDARLTDGSRVNATIPPVSVDGATLTIRKFSDNFLTGDDYVAKGSMNASMLYFLSMCVVAKLSIVVSGATGTGKTTLLNMLSSYIPKDELIITIEESVELKLQQPNVRRMETRPATNEDMMNVNQSQLVRAALRQRPDRIILGETRDGSIVDIISAMSTGHEGSMTTIHANSPENMCDVRVPILYSMNEETDFSESAIAMQVAEAINIIVQIERFPDGSRKVSKIVYVDGTRDLSTGKKVNLEEIFTYDRNTGNFFYSGHLPQKFKDAVKFRGYELDPNYFSMRI